MTTERQLTDVLRELSSAAQQVVDAETPEQKKGGCETVQARLKELITRAGIPGETKLIYLFWKLLRGRNFETPYNEGFARDVWNIVCAIDDAGYDDRDPGGVATKRCQEIVIAYVSFPKTPEGQKKFAATVA